VGTLAVIVQLHVKFNNTMKEKTKLELLKIASQYNVHSIKELIAMYYELIEAIR
jgi:hypothetical protein